MKNKPQKKGNIVKEEIFISMATAIIIGLLVIAGPARGTTAPPSGAQLFKQNCTVCHPQGGNSDNPEVPLKGSPALKTFATFLSWIRQPRSPMPPFPPSKISDKQARRLYDYILKQEKQGWK
jgi:mono/diheme cytochrome c family protein